MNDRNLTHREVLEGLSAAQREWERKTGSRLVVDLRRRPHFWYIDAKPEHPDPRPVLDPSRSAGTLDPCLTVHTEAGEKGAPMGDNRAVQTDVCGQGET